MGETERLVLKDRLSSFSFFLITRRHLCVLPLRITFELGILTLTL